MKPSHLSWASADGLRLHAFDHPAADGAARLPVVCLHGLTRNARDFAEVAPWIAARGRRVIAADVRGRGLSAWDPAARYHLPVYADDAARLLDALGIARAIFVGTSMGGLITIELAALRPALVAGAVINDVGPVLSAAGLRRIAGYVGRGGAVESWEGAADYLRDLNAQALPHYGAAEWLAMARRMFRAEGGRIVPDYDPAIARPFGEAPTVSDPWERWHALATGRPVLLLRGARSDLLDRDVADRMVAGHDRATLREVPDVGHAPMLDEPAARAALADFLDASP